MKKGLLAVSLLSLSSLACAGSYVRVSLNYAQQSSGNITQHLGTSTISPVEFGSISQAKLDNSALGAQLAYGYTFDMGAWQVSPEISYNHYGKINSTINGFLLAPTGQPSITSELKVDNTIQALMLNANIARAISDKFALFARVGVGQARVKSSASLYSESTDIPANTENSSQSKNTFAWALGAGVNYRLSQPLSLQASINYLNLGDITLGKFGESGVYSGTTYKAKLHLTTVNLGVVYQF